MRKILCGKFYAENFCGMTGKMRKIFCGKNEDKPRYPIYIGHYTCIDLYMYVCMHVYIYTHMYHCVYIYTHMYNCVYICNYPRYSPIMHTFADSLRRGRVYV